MIEGWRRCGGFLQGRMSSGGLWFVLLAACGSAGAQNLRYPVPDLPSCSSCSISAEIVRTIGITPTEGVLPASAYFVQMSANGNYIIRPSGAAGEVLVFDQTGRSVVSLSARTIQGSGPDTLAVVLARPLPNGGVELWNLSPASIIVLDASWRVVATTMLAFTPPDQVIQLPDGRYIVNLQLRSADRIGYPLHVLTADRGLAESFGSQNGIYRPDIPGMMTRRLALGRGNTIWAAWSSQYLIEQWNANGSELVELERSPTWFPALAHSPPAGAVLRPSVLEAVWEDAAGLLWTAIRVNDSNVDTTLAADAVERRDRQRRYDTIVEVIDPRSRRVVARTRLDHSIVSFLGGNRAAASRISDAGLAFVDIILLTLQR